MNMKRNISQTPDEKIIIGLISRGEYAQLVPLAQRLLSRSPDHPLGIKALAVAGIGAGRYIDALPLLRRGVKLYPGDPEMHSNLAIVLAAQGLYDDSLASIERALALDPQRADFQANRAVALLHLGFLAESIVSARAALRIDPSHPEANNTLGAAFHRQRKFDDALAAFQAAVANNPTSLDPFLNFVVTLGDLGRHDQAVNCARQVFDEGELSQSESDMLLPHLCAAERASCDWSRGGVSVALRAIMQRKADQGPEPFFMTHIEDVDRAALRLGADVYGRAYLREGGVNISQSSAPKATVAEDSERPLRIGFLSAEFREHPVSELAVGIYECIDRREFSVYAYGYGPNDTSKLRKRLEDAFDVFRDVDALSIVEAATLIRQDEIDILVDMTGWTKFSRSGILACSPAPVVASWLGFPGTLGVPGLAHYLISDPVVTPPDHAGDYVEQLALMPHTYQPSSRVGDILPTPTRESVGLPEDAFVFCSFNQSLKITPVMFELWCELLQRNPQAVLWLGFQSEVAQANLRVTARAKGIAEARIIFAPWCKLPEHHARLALADVALDTFPYGSHTTGSDMLWAGVPLIARLGETFASRVSASLLHAVGLPELVASSDAAYFALADALAKDPGRCLALRQHLRAARASAALFDTRLFARDLGRLFRAMWKSHVMGHPGLVQIAAAAKNGA